MSELLVYFADSKAGVLQLDKKAKLSFVYDAAYLQSETAAPLSCSMPLQSEPFSERVCQAFFSGILPEGQSRSLIAKKLGISQENDFAFLNALGGECVGALSFQTESLQTNSEQQYLPLDANKLTKILHELPKRPLLAGEKDVRLSLAGAQSKIAIKKQGEKLFLPLENSPSTHILKPEIAGFEGIVENEAYCLQLAKAIGLSAVDACVETVANIKYLAVQRYDRLLETDAIIRLHQEDFCQALSILPMFKYQNEGGPSLVDCMNLIKHYATEPGPAILQFLDLVIFNFIIGNNDAHGKNFSFLYDDNKTYLAPAYDLVCTNIYPELSAKQAMKIGGIYKHRDIYLGEFEKMALELGLSKMAVRRRIKQNCTKILNTYKALPIQHSVIAKVILEIKRNIERLS